MCLCFWMVRIYYLPPVDRPKYVPTTGIAVSTAGVYPLGTQKLIRRPPSIFRNSKTEGTGQSYAVANRVGDSKRTQSSHLLPSLSPPYPLVDSNKVIEAIQGSFFRGGGTTMVKAKHQKHKPNKQSHIKKHGGKQVDISEFRAQLDALGLKIIQVTADGNCFFRAFADQVEGNEEEHQRYRSMVVQFILNNREMFEPFIEDDVSFDEYCQSMEKDGTWAGNMELQAASLVTRTNICIHRNMSPRWYIRNFDSHEARMVHLSYHDGEHYNSVRLKEDTSNGPARPIIIKADADLSAISCKAKAAVTKSKGGAGKNVIYADSIKLVMAGSGCEDAKKVEQILQQVGGDVDAANEFLIAEQATSDYLAESDKLSCPADTSHGIFENGNYEQQTEELKDNSCMSEQSCDKETTHDSESSHKDEKKIARNKVCPCGSKKKYKACCGSVSGRSSKFTIIQTVDYSKSRKERKQGKKSGSKDVTNSHGGEGAPDVGALCI